MRQSFFIKEQSLQAGELVQVGTRATRNLTLKIKLSFFLFKHMYFYIAAILLVVLGVAFRKQLGLFGKFMTDSLHAFATEYNDAYAVNDTNEEKTE